MLTPPNCAVEPLSNLVMATHREYGVRASLLVSDMLCLEVYSTTYPFIRLINRAE